VNNAALHLELNLSSDFSLVRADIREALSQPTEAVVEIAVTRDLDLAATVEQEATLRLEVDGSEQRRWTLMVDQVVFLGRRDGSLRYQICLRPRLWFLRYVTDTRKYRNLSARGIVSKLLQQHHVDHAWQLAREPDVRKYCVQYRETTFAFISRLLEFEGIFYSFAGDGTLLLDDSSTKRHDVADNATFGLIESEGAMQWHHQGLFRLAKGTAVASGAATVNDTNWKKPNVSLLATASASEDAELEIYEYPVGFRRPDQGQRLAALRLEALRVPAKFVEGSGNAVAFAVGAHFGYDGIAAPQMEGRYLLQRVHHQFFDTRFERAASSSDEDGISYRNHFHAIPADVVYRPPLTTAHPHIAGSHTAMVRGPKGEEIHTDSHGRFRAQFHWDREAIESDEDSRWLRNMQEVQTGMALARVGWEQSVAYINGDPDRPFGFARNINGTMVPEYGQPGNKTRMTLKTPTYPSNGGFNELRLEDVAGAQHFDWHAEKDIVGMVNNNRLEHVGANETKKVGIDQRHSVHHDQSVTIDGDFDVSIDDDQTAAIDGNRKVTVGGNAKYDLGGNYATSCEQDETETVSGSWEFDVGVEDAGSVVRIVRNDFTRKVSGTHTINCDGNLSAKVESSFDETISGSKLVTVQEGSVGGTVTGHLISNISGSVTRVAKDSAGFGAHRSQVTVTGPCSYLSQQKITLRGDHIRLESSNSMKFDASGCSLELKPAQVVIDGKMKLESATKIVTTGNPHNVTK